MSGTESPQPRVQDHLKWAAIVPNLFDQPGPLIGGILGGSIDVRIRNGAPYAYTFKIWNAYLPAGKLLKYFFVSKHEKDVTKTREAAVQFQYDFCMARNLVKNQYRFIAEGVVEMNLSLGYTTILDVGYLSRVSGYLWHAVNPHGHRYPLWSAKNNRHQYMADIVWGLHEYDLVAHKNGNHLDNRISNLQPASRETAMRMRIRTSIKRNGVVRIRRPFYHAYVPRWTKGSHESMGKHYTYEAGNAESKQEAFKAAMWAFERGK
jgi:hypothetical protein